VVDETEKWDPKDAWRRFRLETEAARNYPFSYAMYISLTHRNPVLEQILPTLLHIKAVAILDEALSLWLEQHDHRLTQPYKEDLNGRLRYLADNALLDGVDRLHDIRKRRNALAHEAGGSCTWSELLEDVAVMEASLVTLDLAGATANLEYFFERAAIEPSAEPGVKFSRRLKYGVKENGTVALEIAWTEQFGGIGSE
jgi:hypothetical protein